MRFTPEEYEQIEVGEWTSLRDLYTNNNSEKLYRKDLILSEKAMNMIYEDPIAIGFMDTSIEVRDFAPGQFGRLITGQILFTDYFCPQEKRIFNGGKAQYLIVPHKV